MRSIVIVRAVVLFEDNFNFLSKMCLARMREAAITMARMALANGCLVACRAPTSPITPTSISPRVPTSACSARESTLPAR